MFEHLSRESPLEAGSPGVAVGLKMNQGERNEGREGGAENLILHLFDCETVRRKKLLLINIISEPLFFSQHPHTLIHIQLSNPDFLFFSCFRASSRMYVFLRAERMAARSNESINREVSQDR